MYHLFNLFMKANVCISAPFLFSEVVSRSHTKTYKRQDVGYAITEILKRAKERIGRRERKSECKLN